MDSTTSIKHTFTKGAVEFKLDCSDGCIKAPLEQIIRELIHIKDKIK